MCLIVDANLASLVFCKNPSKDFLPIINSLSPNKDGILVVGGHLATELDRVEDARRFIRSLLQAGRARRISDILIDEEETRIANLCKSSNDPHVIALARVSGARVLCSRDKKLHKDFKNEELILDPEGHVYQNAKHAHLLRKYGHSEACRRSISESR